MRFSVYDANPAFFLQNGKSDWRKLESRGAVALAELIVPASQLPVNVDPELLMLASLPRQHNTE